MLQIFIINSFSGDETTTIGIREELEKIKDMEYLEKEVFETEYGVSGMVKERRRSYEPESLDRWIAGQHSEGDIGRQVHGASLLCKLAIWPRARWGICKTSG